MALAEIPTRQSPVALVCPQDRGSIAEVRRIMLIALARKLAISLWRYVETGLVPDGAVMAKTTPHMAAAT